MLIHAQPGAKQVRFSDCMGNSIRGGVGGITIAISH
jgi:hypothetical protein